MANTKKSVLRLEQFVPYRLSTAASLVSDVIAGSYRSLFGLTVPQWRLLAVLAERQRATQQQLGVATRMDKLVVSRAAVALVRRRLIRRAKNPRDLRSHLLMLTKPGLTLYAQVVPKAIELESTMLTGFSRMEREQLHEMLRRLEAAALRIRRPAHVQRA